MLLTDCNSAYTNCTAPTYTVIQTLCSIQLITNTSLLLLSKHNHYYCQVGAASKGQLRQ
jgi:hypothetical protein